MWTMSSFRQILSLCRLKLIYLFILIWLLMNILMIGHGQNSEDRMCVRCRWPNCQFSTNCWSERRRGWHLCHVRHLFNLIYRVSQKNAWKEKLITSQTGLFWYIWYSTRFNVFNFFLCNMLSGCVKGNGLKKLHLFLNLPRHKMD